ncbi:MAG: serine/threonine-protein kinase [Polyangiaceae bacterium]
MLLEVSDTFDLTETSGADESRPVVSGERVGFAARPLFEGAGSTAHVLDLSGQGPVGPDWTRFERLQTAITNWQQTGQARGIARRTYALEGDPKEVAVTVANGELVVVADGRHGLLTEDQTPAWLRGEDVELARPGNLVTWSVDRVRAIPWIGDDAMQSFKALAFTLLDFVLRNKEAVTGDTGAEGIAEDLGQNQLDPPTKKVPVDPEMGWPPPPLEAWVTPALPGEGQWNSLDNDPFVNKNPGLPGAFVTTFVRTDRTRKATRVYVALWDPRQVELHMMAGTVEPKSATGEAGPGLIPRTPEVMKRVVAASNAGFQALHGEFGMMADGVVYLPPKPYAATVAALKDGTTAFGTWPNSQAIPEDVRSYRQNMTVMVEDEKFNPYGRTWWGGTVPGSEDKTHTVRTGICMTREGFVAYFYGADISPDALSQAMIQARCKYGLALDMNGGHAGLEFYNVQPSDEYRPLDRRLSHDWEAEGTVPAIDGWKFRGRRFIRGMGLMNFPRFNKRDARAVFYRTLRPVRTGAPVPGGAAEAEPGKDGAWRVKGLPQHGFPYALALTEIGTSGAGLRVLKIDPRTVHPAAAAEADPTVAVFDAGPSPGATEVSLWHSQSAFSVADKPPVAGAVRLASGMAEGGQAMAAVGIADDDGMLVYVERAPTGAAPPAPRPAGSAAAPIPAGRRRAARRGARQARLLHAHPARALPGAGARRRHRPRRRGRARGHRRGGGAAGSRAGPGRAAHLRGHAGGALQGLVPAPAAPGALLQETRGGHARGRIAPRRAGGGHRDCRLVHRSCKTSPPLSRIQVFGPYELLERVGVGSMGEVFRAVERDGGRVVALKRLMPFVGADPDVVEALQGEANLALALDHPSVAKVYAVGDVGGTHYIAYEYVDGRDLRAIRDRAQARGTPIPLEVGIHVVQRIALALDHAHGRRDGAGKLLGLVHRDVCPSNILVAFDGSVKLSDFGIARAEGRVSRTEAGQVKGKVGYMSPEQVKGGAVDGRSDIYALGVCLWELATGTRLHDGIPALVVMERIASSEVPSPRSVAPDLSESLERVIAKSLAHSPEQRYPTAADLHDDLTEVARELGRLAPSTRVAQYVRSLFPESAAQAAPIDGGRGSASAQESPIMADSKGGSDLDVFEGLAKKSQRPAPPGLRRPPPSAAARQRTLVGGLFGGVV